MTPTDPPREGTRSALLGMLGLVGALNTLTAVVALLNPEFAKALLAVIVGNFLVASFFASIIWAARRLIGPPSSDAAIAARETLRNLRGIPSSGAAD